MKELKASEDSIISAKFFKKLKNWKEVLYNNIFLLNSHSQSLAESAAEEFLMGMILINSLEDISDELKPADGISPDELKYRLNIINRVFHISLFSELLNSKVNVDEEIFNNVFAECREINIKEELNGNLSEAVGVIYEYLRYLQPKSSSAKAKRKAEGVYYTPVYIVDHIIENTIGQKFYESRDGIPSLRVFDPACGSGIFLLRGYDYIINYLSRTGTITPEKKKEVLQQSIFGTDIDSNAVELTKLSMCLKLLPEIEINNLPDLSKNFDSINFLLDKTPLFDHFSDKFDVIIGNPPYNAKLSDNERAVLKKKYDLGTTDTAALFMNVAYEKLIGGGVNCFIIPKPFVYSSNWEKVRAKFLPGIFELIDCGTIWDEVKLEQVIYSYEKDRHPGTYLSGIRRGKEFFLTGELNKQLYNDFGIILNGITEEELKTGLKIKESSLVLNDVVDNHRGAPLQKMLHEDKSDFAVIGGKQIESYTINSGIKGYYPLADLNDSRAIIKPDSILVQNIVAHIQKPHPAIKITAALANSFNYHNYLILDTVNQLHNKSELTSEFICAVLNSKIVSWYVYNFIFGRAIRTMHFDNYVTKRIPFPHVDLTVPEQKKNYEKVNKLVYKLIDVRKEEPGHKSFAKKLIDTASGRNEKKILEEIELLVTGFFGLTEEEP